MSEETGSVEAGNPQPEAQQEAPAQAEVPADAPFYSSFKDEDLRGFVENKGVKQPEQLASMYRNLEKVFGADKAGRTVVIPGPDAEGDALGEFYNRLGRPEKADGYELPVPEGDDGKLADWAKGVFYEAGLTNKQAAAVAEKWNEYIGGIQGESAQDQQMRAEQAASELRREWGAAYDSKVNNIEKAAEKLGMTEEQLKGLHSSMGPTAAMKFVDGLATKLGEAPIDNGGEPSGDSMLTPHMAREEWAKLGADKGFMDMWLNRDHPNHKWAVRKKESLHMMMAGHPANMKG